MEVDKYDEYLAKTKELLSKEVHATEEALKTSSSKKDDYQILGSFWNTLYVATRDDPSFNELYSDGLSMLPMPASVQKQFLSQLFAPKHLNLLWDLAIDEDVSVDFTPEQEKALGMEDAEAEL